MESVPRIDVHDLKDWMKTPEPPLLVLAYDDDRRLDEFPLEGAIPFSALEKRKGSLPKDQGIVFYCG